MAPAPDVISRPSPNFNERRDGKKPTLLVQHYTGMQSAEAALERLCDKKAGVSSHYLIDEAGVIFQLVDEEKRAWHAGVGYWRGEEDLNSASIGIEIVNPGHEFGYQPFPEPQIRSVIHLSKAIVERHSIQPINVIGHSDLAPSRKQDPGELFPWAHLAEEGIGLWISGIEAAPVPKADVKEALKSLGYDLESNGFDDVLLAFQRHWVPDQLGQGCTEKTGSVAIALVNSVENLTRA
ncbi:MAG: N-acetylmuramoyl-L-alanine amidase [Sneathiellales bacterium]|nr:N-acetylmuramoyl-L-alanine amidase [Sneathiellales bacterium]